MDKLSILGYQKILEKGVYDGSCKTNYKTDKGQQ